MDETSSRRTASGLQASSTRGLAARARATSAARRLRSLACRARHVPCILDLLGHPRSGLGMQAIVLVGGEGTRLRPLTATVPKPALTIVDRPFLAYMIEWLATHGVTEVVLACGFLPDILREALVGEEERAGVRIRYVVEPEPRGTAGAIRFAADELGGDLDERFFALNGDVLTDLDLSALLRTHEERGARATIGLHPVADSSAYGLVSCDADGRVLEFLEKTGEAAPGEINAG